MRTYKLFLDDERNPEECQFLPGIWRKPVAEEYKANDWTVVRSHDAFVQHILSYYANGYFPSLVSFDNDLGKRSKEGTETARWLVRFCIDNEVALPECLVHSMNSVRSGEIKCVIMDYQKEIDFLKREK